MSYEEAIAWLNGERSMINIIPAEPDRSTWQVRVAQADAARCRQAYWIVRARKERLTNKRGKDDE